MSKGNYMSSSDRRRRKAKVLKRDRYRCVRCGSGDRLTLDHILPKAFGGSNALHNLQTLCYACNQAKGDGFA